MSVSVVIPCYNVEDYIYECLDSVKLQGECVDEIFCVDNNSTDNTI
ncbi:MAG: glycosyltransferase family 2 protein, partial [Flavobacteriales bacterium]